MLLHLSEVDLVVEVDDVFGLQRLLIDNTLSIYLSHIFLILVEMSILVNDVVESQVSHVTYLGHGIDGAHNELVKVSVDEEVGGGAHQ